MSLTPVSDETMKMFGDKMESTMLPESVKWAVLHDENFKKTKSQFYGKTVIMNQIAVNRGCEDVVFIINEDIFDRLDEKYQKMSIDKLIAYINYNFDKETLKTEQPNFTEHEDVLLQHDPKELMALRSEVSRIYNDLKQEDSENKS